MMVMYNKQELSNIWSWINEKVKQHWGWVERKCCLYKKACIDQNTLSQADYRVFKSSIVPEQIDETASFFACGYKFIKIKSWSKIYWLVMVKNGCGHLVSRL